MQRLNLVLVGMACAVMLAACGAKPAGTTDAAETMPVPPVSASEATIDTVAPPETTEQTEETTTMTTETTTETTIETTAETTMQTASGTTATAETAETTAEKPVATAATTAATTAAVPAMTAPTVREGEYPEGETTVETIDGFTYVNGILIANKTYLLPADYDPGKILPEAQTAFDTMRAAAKEEGLTLKIVSGYRSYKKQDKVYHNYAARDGAALADRYSARAGSSEHQTGYAMDINSVRQSFAETKEGKWLAAHCAEYGFILRYPKDKEAETGFMYEPWHIRYLGVELAQKITESGLCLEEYLGITSAYAEEQQ